MKDDDDDDVIIMEWFSLSSANVNGRLVSKIASGFPRAAADESLIACFQRYVGYGRHWQSTDHLGGLDRKPSTRSRRWL